MPTGVTVNNHLITNPRYISNSFNDYQSGIAESILKERKHGGFQEGYGNFVTYMPSHEPASITLHHGGGDDVYYIINGFYEKEGTDPCRISSKTLKLISVEISRSISWFANVCFSTGAHPEKLKLAKVSPIYKNGSNLLTCNDHPISLSPNLKILEKLTFCNVYSFLEKSKKIYKLQYVFYLNIQ